jgi:hypothetical protein
MKKIERKFTTAEATVIIRQNIGVIGIYSLHIGMIK